MITTPGICTHLKERIKEVFTWMIQATVYPDKSLSGWTDPIRLTGKQVKVGALMVLNLNLFIK